MIEVKSRREVLRFGLIILMISGLSSLLLTGLSLHVFGSAYAGIACLSGQPLVISTNIDLGTLSLDELRKCSVRVLNISRESITI